MVLYSKRLYINSINEVNNEVKKFYGNAKEEEFMLFGIGHVSVKFSDSYAVLVKIGILTELLKWYDV